MISSGIIEIDLHKKTIDEAIKAIDATLSTASSSVYIIRLIHGYHGGTRIKNSIIDEYSYGRHPKVKRIQGGWNLGITELILREL